MINFENSLLSPRYPGEHVSLASSLSSPTHSCSVSNGGSEGEVALLRLMERTGYNIIQENGQRKYGGPPPGWSHQAPPPVKGSEVFVGKLPRDLFEDELVPVFEKVGRIYEVRLMMDFSGTNRGYAFVMFFTPEEAARAVRLLNNFEIRRGRFIGVVKSVDNCRLFIGGLPKNKSRQEVFDEMKRVTEGVRDVIIYSSVADKSKSRGFAFVEYDCHKSAAMARRRLIPGRIQLWNHNIAVDWALPEPDVDDDVMSKVTALYVRNLLLSTNEETIRQAFNRVPGVSVSRVKKLRDFAFVHFVSREQAFRAMVAYNNRELDGSIVEVVWAKPAERCRTSRSSSPPQSYSHQCSDGLVIHGAVRSPCKQKGLLSHSSPANISSQISSLVGSDSITRSSTVSPSPFLQPPPITSQVYDVDAALMRMMCHPPPILPQSDSTGVHGSVANHPTLESSSKISNACINHLATMFDQQSLGGYIYNKRQSNFVF